jgi:hypothetical protein
MTNLALESRQVEFSAPTVRRFPFQSGCSDAHPIFECAWEKAFGPEHSHTAIVRKSLAWRVIDHVKYVCMGIVTLLKDLCGFVGIL